MSDAIRALAASLVSRKQAGLQPYVLFLGAGASISSGCSSMLRLIEDVLQARDATQFNVWQKEIAEASATNAIFGELLRNDIVKKKLARFFDIWGALDSESRFAILRTHLWNDKVPSVGYINLAYLVKEGYFSVILSTNLDNLMEKALNKVDLQQPENFIVVVNGKDSPDEVQDQLEHSRVPVKLVKLHGTLESPRSYAFTIEELFSFEKTIKPALGRLINQSLLVVGHSMQDRDITVLFEDEGKEIHFVNPSGPELGSPIDNVLKVRSSGSIIEGEEGKFDNFFRQLRAAIELITVKDSILGSTLPIDGFLQSIGYESELKAPRSRYKNLQTLYVKPTEYEDILVKLEHEHVLFIIGEPHMGKTYTAIYLLWEYYQKGYETLHIRHDDLINRLHRHDGDLKSLLLELFTPVSTRPRIIHFDDPFGETLERRTDAFANGLDILLDMASSYEHLRVLVTSRMNIFNEALAENQIHTNLAELEKTLRVHTSYRQEVLLDILHRYVHFYKPAWATDERILAELDEKLPDMLPAPHNIEFFVSTSGPLNTIDDVLAHVEESKKMISALASWMKHMPPHEQVFLMWIEVGSTAGILFPGAAASEVNVEKAFNRTLAFLFEEGHISGIPVMPFSSARDKFETILLERRDEDGRLIRLDFVHPSYHEAFWYGIAQQFPVGQWWELLCKHVRLMMRGIDNRIDQVQLKMIERYGSTNRDLDNLLLLSAESQDANEQLIALEHMLKRSEYFALFPQFWSCVKSVISAKDALIKIGFLDLYDKYFNQLPIEMFELAPPFLFDVDREARGKAREIIGARLDDLPEHTRRSKAIEQWQVVTKLFTAATSLNSETSKFRLDWWDELVYNTYEQEVPNKFVSLAPSEISALMQLQDEEMQKGIFKLGTAVANRLSPAQRRALLSPVLFEMPQMQQTLMNFVGKYYTNLTDIGDQYPIIKTLTKFQQSFNFREEEDLKDQLRSLPGEHWPALTPSSLREYIDIPLLGNILTERVLEEYKQIAPEYRDAYLEALFSPTSANSLIDYVQKNKYNFENISDEVLIKLLSAKGMVQYEVLPALLSRFDHLSKDDQQVIYSLIDTPSGIWIGGAVGQLGWEKFKGKLSKAAIDIFQRVINLQQKQITGAVLSELAQSYLDAKHFGLQKEFEATLYSLIKDPEIIQYAEQWMDYTQEHFNFNNESYWSDIKKRLRQLSARSE